MTPERVAEVTDWPRISRKKDGYLMIRTDGQCRYMTLLETFKYRWLGHIPEWLTRAGAAA